jgi:CheY-like chemotaxis protein
MLRVLVVDDWPDTIPTLQLLLQTWGYETCVASDGLTALTIAEDFKPDVVILDLGLPGMDGFEVAKRLRQNDRERPLIIVLSGYCTKDDVQHSSEVGCDFHLAKPAEPDEIERILTGFEQQQPVA